MYYFIAPLEVEEGGTPKFASLYVHDPTLRDVARKNNLYLPKNTPKKERDICENILIELQNELMQHNPYVHDILQMCQIPDEQLNEASFVITEKERPANAGTRTYTSHHLKEVSVMMPDEVGTRDTVIKWKSGDITEIADTSRAT